MNNFDPEKVMAEISEVLARHGAILVNRYPELIELRMREREPEDAEWSPEVFGQCVYLPTKISPFNKAELNALNVWQQHIDQLYEQKFPRFPREERASEVKIVCQMGFYDGILKGLAEVDNWLVFFNCIDEHPEHSMPREFVYWKLSGTELDAAMLYQQSLKDDGWLHLFYDDTGKRFPPLATGTRLDYAGGPGRERFKQLMEARSQTDHDGWFTYADTNLGETTREEEIAWHKELIIDHQIETWDHGARIALPD